jgi:hypothetical protein
MAPRSIGGTWRMRERGTRLRSKWRIEGFGCDWISLHSLCWKCDENARNILACDEPGMEFNFYLDLLVYSLNSHHSYNAIRCRLLNSGYWKINRIICDLNQEFIFDGDSVVGLWRFSSDDLFYPIDVVFFFLKWVFINSLSWTSLENIVSNYVNLVFERVALSLSQCRVPFG